MKPYGKRSERRARRGWAMLTVVFVIVAVSAALAVMLTTSAAADRSANVAKNASAARFRAEGGLAAAQRALLVAVADWQAAPAGGTVDIDGVTVAYEITPTGFARVETDATGIQTRRTRYRIESRAELSGAEETLQRVVDTLAVPIFQFAVFYTDDLEINPGPDMTLRGRIHTNADLFLNCGGTLTLDSNYVHAVGNLYRRRKDQRDVSQGTVRVREWVADPFDPAAPASYAALNSAEQMLALGVLTTSGYDSDFKSGYDADGDGDFTGADDWLPFALGALAYWDAPAGATGQASTIQTSDHGLSAAVPPGVGSIAAFEPAPAGGDYDLDPATGEYVRVAQGTGAFQAGFFHAQAGLSILASADGSSWSAFDASGADVSASLAGVVTLGSVYDAREGGDVSVIQIDMAALDASAVFPSNGLLYAAGESNGTGREACGVRLVNGSELAAPLTVASDGAVYVQGDYNTVAKKGAAVIADALDLLSNAWDDTKRAGALPRARETTYDLAFISGNLATTDGAYNGGFENLPRFHEDWNGVVCHLTGSFVNAWASQHATGAWVYGGDRYTAPRRDFAYDPAFNDAANLPPFTPLVVSGEALVTW